MIELEPDPPISRSLAEPPISVEFPDPADNVTGALEPADQSLVAAKSGHQTTAGSGCVVVDKVGTGSLSCTKQLNRSAALLVPETMMQGR